MILSSKYLFLTIFSLLVFIYVIQLDFDSWEKYSKPKLNIQYNDVIAPNVLDGDKISKLTFGFDNLIADWYWLNAIQFYGGGDPYGKYFQLTSMMDNVTIINPKFYYPYIFSLLVLPNENMSDQALSIGERGRKNFPDDWQIPYYMGAVYHIEKKDYQNAGKYLEIASQKKDVLPIAKLLAGIYYQKADQREIAYNIYQVILETSTDEYTKQRASLFLKQLELETFLEDMAIEYKNKYGVFPNQLTDLVTKKILTEIPNSPLNRELIIDPNTGKVNEKPL